VGVGCVDEGAGTCGQGLMDRDADALAEVRCAQSEAWFGVGPGWG